MKAKPHLERSMQEQEIRTALNTHWRGSAVDEANADHDIYDGGAICDYPAPDERILGRSNLQALRSHHPIKPSGFKAKRILGNGDLWITEYTITYQGRLAYAVSIMEFRNGKAVQETQYFGDSFETPAWRKHGFSRARDADAALDEEIRLADSRPSMPGSEISLGGADGMIANQLKKTEEQPLTYRFC